MCVKSSVLIKKKLEWLPSVTIPFLTRSASLQPFRSAFVAASTFGNKFNDLMSQRSHRVSGSDIARIPYSIHKAGLSFL